MPMEQSWILQQGDTAVLVSLALGGYLAAASTLWLLKPSGARRVAIGLAIAAVFVIGALSLALTPYLLGLGIAVSVVVTAVGTGAKDGRAAVPLHAAAMALLGLAVAFRPDESTIWVTYWQSEPTVAARTGVYLAAFAIATVPASELIASGMRQLGLPHREQVGEGDDAEVRRGRVIGMLERSILLTLALLGQWQTIGFVVAAKSLARYRQLDEQHFAEYYLIGTLASLLIAVIIGVGATLIT